MSNKLKIMKRKRPLPAQTVYGWEKLNKMLLCSSCVHKDKKKGINEFCCTVKYPVVKGPKLGRYCQSRKEVS